MSTVSFTNYKQFSACVNRIENVNHLESEICERLLTFANPACSPTGWFQTQQDNTEQLCFDTAFLLSAKCFTLSQPELNADMSGLELHNIPLRNSYCSIIIKKDWLDTVFGRIVLHVPCMDTLHAWNRFSLLDRLLVLLIPTLVYFRWLKCWSWVSDGRTGSGECG